MTSTVFAQRVVSIGPPVKQELIFLFTKTEEASVQLTRLTDSKMTLSRSKSDPSYTGTIRLLDDSHGICSFGGVVPGDYMLEISAFKLKTSLRIPEKTSGRVAYEVSIGKAISITESSVATLKNRE